MNTSLAKKRGLPLDNPFGIWLSKFDFDDCEQAKEIAQVRNLPQDGPFYLFQPYWLKNFDSIVESRATTSPVLRVRAASKIAAALHPTEFECGGPVEPEYGYQVTWITSGKIRRRLNYRFRDIDDDCFFECVNSVGDVALGVDISPFFLTLDSEEPIWSRALLNNLDSLLTYNVSREFGRRVEKAIHADNLPSQGNDLTIVGFAVKFDESASTLTTAWSSIQAGPDIWNLRKNIEVTSRLVIDPTEPLQIPTAANSLEVWANTLLEESHSARDECRQEIATLEKKLSDKKRRLGSINLIISSTSSSLKDRFALLFERLKTDTRVAFIGLNGLYLVLRTNDVYVPLHLDRPDDQQCFLGQYEFRTSLNSHIRIRNLKPPVSKEERIHPHSLESAVCIGTYSNTINNCFQAFDYYTLMLTLLEWTTDINHDDRRAVVSLSNEFKASSPPSKQIPSRWIDFVDGVAGDDNF